MENVNCLFFFLFFFFFFVMALLEIINWVFLIQLIGSFHSMGVVSFDFTLALFPWIDSNLQLRFYHDKNMSMTMLFIFTMVTKELPEQLSKQNQFLSLDITCTVQVSGCLEIELWACNKALYRWHLFVCCSCCFFLFLWSLHHLHNNPISHFTILIFRWCPAASTSGYFKILMKWIPFV